MKQYQSIKKVSAEEMDYHTAGGLGLVRDYDINKSNEDGYKVVYSDSYSSWSPKKAFEDGYIRID